MEHDKNLEEKINEELQSHLKTIERPIDEKSEYIHALISRINQIEDKLIKTKILGEEPKEDFLFLIRNFYILLEQNFSLKKRFDDMLCEYLKSNIKDKFAMGRVKF